MKKRPLARVEQKQKIYGETNSSSSHFKFMFFRNFILKLGCFKVWSAATATPLR
jgi:hypothetical protein